ALAVSPAFAGARITHLGRNTAAAKLDLPSVDGGRLGIGEMRGQVVLLNFWASWCEPCLAELGALNKIARQSGRDVRVVGINYMEGPDAIRRVVEGESLVFPILRDSDGAAFKVWANGVLPASILIDRRGQPRARIDGEIDWAGPEAQSALAELINEK